MRTRALPRKGAPHGRRLASLLIDGETFGLPASAAPALQMLAGQCQALSGQIADLERALRQRSVQDEASRRLLQVPGIGPITATRWGMGVVPGASASTTCGISTVSGSASVSACLALARGSGRWSHAAARTKAGSNVRDKNRMDQFGVHAS